MPILLRLAVQEKDMVTVKNILINLAETRFASETDAPGAIIGFLVEGGDIWQMSEIAEVLEKVLDSCSGVQSGKEGEF